MLQIAEYIAKNYKGKIIEIGIGYYWDVAIELIKRGLDVIAVDVKEIPVRHVKFFRDDIINPNLSIYEGSSLIYSIRPPPELHNYIISIARSVHADCIIRPFGNEYCVGGRLVNYKGERFYLFKNAEEM